MPVPKVENEDKSRTNEQLTNICSRSIPKPTDSMCSQGKGAFCQLPSSDKMFYSTDTDYFEHSLKHKPNLPLEERSRWYSFADGVISSFKEVINEVDKKGGDINELNKELANRGLPFRVETSEKPEKGTTVYSFSIVIDEKKLAEMYKEHKNKL
ncbi:MAG: hypothetical protein QW035_01065 [Candidatus Anstonellales archaeon]